LTFCLGVIGKGSYFWLTRGTIPIVLPATFEKRVKEVMETEDRRVVWYSGKMGINILALDIEYVKCVKRLDNLEVRELRYELLRDKVDSCPSLCYIRTGLDLNSRQTETADQ